MSSDREHDEKYPMCAKLSSVREESQSIGRFLDWLGERDPRITLCLCEDHEYYPASVRFESLLAEYFEIDENKLEEERRAMLEELREKNNAS